jgi:hypothetical protein
MTSSVRELGGQLQFGKLANLGAGVTQQSTEQAKWVFRGNVTGHSGASSPTIPAERDRGFRSERDRFWWSPE